MAAWRADGSSLREGLLEGTDPSGGGAASGVPTGVSLREMASDSKGAPPHEREASGSWSGPGGPGDGRAAMDGRSVSFEGSADPRLRAQKSSLKARHKRTAKRLESTGLRGTDAHARLYNENVDADKSTHDGTVNHGDTHFQKMHGDSHVHSLTTAEKKLMFSYESLDYDIPVNAIYEREVHNDSRWHVKKVQIAMWIVFAFIGISTGLLAYALSVGVDFFTTAKFNATLPHVVSGETGTAFVLFLLISVGYVTFSTFLVAVIEPVAGGSGIPEIKGYLNGTNYQRFLRLKTLACKAVGVIFSVSGGLIIGKEGPLVHSGAVFAANISHLTYLGRLNLPGKLKKKLMQFRNDRAKRDFVAGGAAAGVAAAFGAPVGGILFSLEEASSFWSTQLTWMVFLASMLGQFMLNLLKVAEGGDGTTFGGLISCGPPLSDAPFHVWETPFFILLAIFGGLMGAAFNHINERICRWRRDELAGKPIPRMIEAMSVAALTAICAFWAPHFFNGCSKIPAFDIDFQHKHHVKLYSQYTCQEGEFNTMASMLFTTTELSIRGFFHNTGEYEQDALLAYFFVVFLLAVVTYGIAVPSGLFVPCILMGCGFGRLVGELLRHAIGPQIVPGTYAVIGATAALGGVARMTISLTVIILETTQDVQFITPIMITLMVSKWVGDLFNISLYDLHVELKCMPFVESSPSGNMYSKKAVDIMSTPVASLRQHVTVGEVHKLLTSCPHNGFPVIADTAPHVYIGTILRNQLAILIKHRAFGEDPSRNLHMTDFATSLSSRYTKLPSAIEMEAIKDERINLGPIMNPVPISVQEGCPLSRVFVLFRSLGIRHLVVVSRNNEVRGIITRKEIMSSFDQDLF